jgi:hypothetical protein
MIKIQITNNDGKTLCISGFSEKKAKHITKTNQWDYVMKTILGTIKK